MPPLLNPRADLLAARRAAAARPLVDLRLVSIYRDLVEKVGAIASRRLAGRA